MKKRYFLLRVFFVIMSALILSFLSNGCSNNKQQVKEQKELKYPDWPGLDYKINRNEDIINKHNEKYKEKLTSFYRQNISPEDIKWHIYISNITKQQLEYLLIKYSWKIYKASEKYQIYRMIVPDIEKLSYYCKELKENKDFKNIHYSLNQLLEFSEEHYHPITGKAMIVVFNENSKIDAIKKIEEKYNLTRKSTFNDLKIMDNYQYIYILSNNVNIVKQYVSLLDETIVELIWFESLTTSGNYYEGK